VKNAVRKFDKIKGDVGVLARKVWNHPELALEETYAAGLYREYLEVQGFRVELVEGLPTALVAEYGSGHPIVGVLGEYDALPSLSQKVSIKKEPADETGVGHGCAHNLLGAASAVACVAVKKSMEELNIPGTVRFYGCPAEEIGKGKAIMDELGVFDDLDACLTWHPGPWNAVTASRLSALMRSEFFFHGVGAHAGAHPELGRSALDGVELMNVGANYLREHIPMGTRLHYIITNGGQVVNTVPEEASVQYVVRAPKSKIVHEVFERLKKVADGAAMMTETEVSFEVQSDNFDTKNNTVLEDLMDEAFQECGEVEFTPEERKLAEELVRTLPEGHYKNSRAVYGVEEGVYLDGKPRPILGRGDTFGASSDIGHVTYKVPTMQCSATCFPLGVPLHSWQATASAGSDFGIRGATHMAKVLVCGMERLLTDNTGILEKAMLEFLQEE
jgi:aminobenzoyl-glutamate utilization protein B